MLKQSIQMAWKAITANKGRSILTMLGVIIGVTAVVVLISMVNATTSKITGQISDLGSNIIVVNIKTDRYTPYKLQDIQQLRKSMVSGAENHDIDILFDQAEAEVARALSALEPSLVKMDPTLQQAVAASSGQIGKIIEGLKEKTYRAGRRKHDELLQQLDRAELNLFPEGKPQERVVNIFHYINKYGPGLIDDLKKVLQGYSAETHLIVEL